jgi:glycosyltransferase involved in cell wall biosynthesis
MQMAFAVPGDLDARTGGTLYDKQVIAALGRLGHKVTVVPLPGDWPNPTAPQEDAALAALDALPAGMPVIIDGLAFGAMAPERVAGLARPVVAMVHHPLALEPGLDGPQAQAMHAREQANLAHAGHMVVPSRHIGDLLRAQFGVGDDRVSVALPGFARPKPALSPPRADPPLVLSVGLLCGRKGHDVLIRALAQVADLPWQATIVGKRHDAAYAAELERLSGNLGLSTRITLAGELGAEALGELYRSATLFALATRYEGYGMVLSEAQLYGLPVLSCDAGAVSETLGGSGLLVPPDDVDAFAGQLRAVLSDPSLQARLARQSRDHAAKLPRWEDAAAVMAQAVDLACHTKGMA